MNNKPGYVLVVTLMIISLAIGLLTTVMQRSFIFQDTALFEIQRQKARALALSGIQVAFAQLALIIPAQEITKESQASQKETTKDNKNTQENKKKLTAEQEWLSKLLSLINRWQQFTLKEERDGVEGILELYISCQQGKININSLLTPESKQEPDKKDGAKQNEASKDSKAATTAKPGEPTVPDSAKNSKSSNLAQKSEQKKTSGQVIQELISPLLKVNILDALRATTKSLARPLVDPTEILGQESLKSLKNNIFISAPSIYNKEGSKTAYLTDIFTADTTSNKINPWLLSNSLCLLFGFNTLANPQEGEKPGAIKDRVKLLQKFMIWPSQWNTVLAPTYGKTYSSIAKEISMLFSSQFEANTFSVISYAQVGTITQKICAILEKTTTPPGLSLKSMTFKLKKLYWL